MGRKLIIDSENLDLLNHRSIDYSQMPYKLKEDFRVHCIVCKDVETKEYFAFYPGEKLDVYDITTGECIEHEHHPVERFPEWMAQECSMVVGHNVINYDLLVFKLFFGMDYSIGEELKHGDKLNGHKVFIHDTLVLSKLLNPDRSGGHSIKAWGERLGLAKDDYNGGFEEFNKAMLTYCFRDVDVNEKVYDKLKEEWGDWKWGNAYQLEKAVAELITRQEHYGFKFDTELANWCVQDLQQKLKDIEERVEPRLPMKTMNKGEAKEYTPPKSQFKKDGTLTANMEKWLEKHGAEITESEEVDVGAKKSKILTLVKKVKLYGEEHSLPLDTDKPVKDKIKMKLSDQKDIKFHLIELGWEPTSWKDKDITIDSKKQKLSMEKFYESVERYLEETLGSPYERYRCAHLKATPQNIRDKMLGHDMNKPLKVITSPTYTVDQEKTLCPNLIKLGEKVDYVEDIVYWLTYKHRLNVIWSEATGDKKEPTGWLANPRIDVDGRVSTPADTLGCNTSRFQHKDVANVPRVTSLYGEYMRGLFHCEDYQVLIGSDADGLESRIEAHYTKKYPGGDDYIKDLLAPKPFDIHTVTAQKVSEIIGEEIDRDAGKKTRYSCSYGAQAAKLAKDNGWPISKGQLVYDAFWEASRPLKLLKNNLEKYWSSAGGGKYVLGLDGRKLMTRSKHSLINTLFQSAGVICMKRAMVWLDKELEKLDKHFDPFKHSDKEDRFFQNIAYHDELEGSVLRNTVTDLQVFSSEEEAEEYKNKREEETGKIYSDVGHKNDKYYVAYSWFGEMAAKSVEYGGHYYNLRVPLTAGYSIGRSWADVH